ncbi:MAG: hypothetical protein ACREQ9_15265, partial [Candidatus Binatia bacterium]
MPHDLLTRIRLALFLLLSFARAASPAELVWRDNDDLAAPEPAEDREGDFLWWHDARSLSLYQAGKVLDLGAAARSIGEWTGLAGPREAANVNALDEAPDSTWFTNRHAAHPLTAEEIARGPADGRPPSPDGPLTIVSGKGLGEVPGFIVEDEKGDRYLVKFDPVDHPELATGAEQVSARIVHALGWNVPDYHLAVFDPARLVIGEGARIEDEHGRKRPMVRSHVEEILAEVSRRGDGRLRASMSRMIPGEPKGPFRFEGMRRDDANDTIPHEHRRDLRGFRIVAAWIHHTDFRPANTLDVFVVDESDPRGHGHLVHYLLDFSSTLGSADLEWKHPKLGHEYTIDPPVIVANLVALGAWVKPWEDLEVTHPTIGYLKGEPFDPERWVTEYPNPIFDGMTARDAFWGAKLVASFRDEDLRAVIRSGEWSDARVEEILFTVLRERRERILRSYFDVERVNPVDRFRMDAAGLAFDDLAVAAGIVGRSAARYRYRLPPGEWVESAEPVVPLEGAATGAAIELE